MIAFDETPQLGDVEMLPGHEKLGTLFKVELGCFRCIGVSALLKPAILVISSNHEADFFYCFNVVCYSAVC